MRRTFPSCSGSAPTSIHARPSATKATPARPTAKPHAIAASFPSSRPRRTRRTGPPSSPERSTGGVPASSRPSASSNASSASPYAARRQSETLLPSSRSSQASSWPNPSTRPRFSGQRVLDCRRSQQFLRGWHRHCRIKMMIPSRCAGFILLHRLRIVSIRDKAGLCETKLVWGEIGRMSGRSDGNATRNSRQKK
ncbi:hypothetical protein SAMN02746000_03366 [Paracoccus sp. J56]|nr:hypothetical protein SAMN02746000_03366 [Paracoccus sp. J56]